MRALLHFAVVISLISSAAMSTPFAAETKVIDGVTHVINDEKPANPRSDIHLKELWRVGGEDDEDLLLGVIGSVIGDDKGNIYLIDSQLNQVLMIGPDGEYLNTLGGEGDGPGEVRGLGSALIMPDGQLGLVQSFPGKVITVNLDNTPGRMFHYQGAGVAEGTFGYIVAGLARAGTFILTGANMSMQGPINIQSYYLSSCSSEGEMIHQFYSKEHALDYSGYTATEIGLDFAWVRFDISPSGELYAAPERNEYKIEIHQSDGTLSKIISRDYSPYVRTGEDTELARRFIEAVHNNHPVPPQAFDIEKTDADIADLQVMPNGELWIRSSKGMRNLPDGVGSIYDVFNTDGVFDRQVALHGDFDPERDLVRMIGQDRFVVVLSAGASYLNSMGVSGDGESEEEAQLIEVICYELR